MPFLSASTVEAAQEALGIGFGDERLEGADGNAGPSDTGFSDVGQGQGTLGCARRDHGEGHGHNAGGGNVRVNQDCSFRRQAEEEITYSPADPSNPSSPTVGKKLLVNMSRGGDRYLQPGERDFFAFLASPHYVTVPTTNPRGSATTTTRR